MVTKRRIREPEEEPDVQPEVAKPRATEPEPVPVHTTPPAAPSTVADSSLGEYEINGATYMLSAAEAEKRGAKAVSRPANKAVTPSNK